VHGARLTGLALAAGSGILYGLVNVLAKPIDLHPFWKTALLYAASALALSPFLRGLSIAPGDRWKVATMGVFGGGLAPVLLFYGLQETAATDAGFLLTLEMVATAALAFAFLHERYTLRDSLGLGCLLATACLVAAASAGGGSQTTLRGALFVLAAAVSWGVDNAVSARLVGTYRVPQLIAVKGLIGAGCAAVALAAARPPAPPTWPLAAMVGLGIVSIAVSSVLFYHALRHIGAARTSAMNIGTTAIIGAAGGWLLLHEPLSWWHGLALVMLASGAAFLWRAQPATPPDATVAKGS